MKTGLLDERVLRSLFLEALADQDERPQRSRKENDVVMKGYVVDRDEMSEPSVVNVLNELDRRVRKAA